MKTEPISITRLGTGDLLAEQTTSHALSHYGSLIWSILDPEPCAGPAIWRQGANRQELDVLEVRDGWLIVRQQSGVLAGIIWSDGTYFADVLIDGNGHPATELQDGLRVRAAVHMGEGLGAVLG